MSYLYNADGIRTSKTVNGVKHTYYLMGSTIVYETWGSNYIEYLYDENGLPQSMYYYNGTSRVKYYFIKNLQGDVIQLRSSSNAVIANYSYDAWGKVLSITDANGNAITSSTHIANINPIRYRGYYYDTETGLYYLNSRYYDPTTGRFLNADELWGANRGMLVYNMYAYCGNEPIYYSDEFGCAPNLDKNIHDAVLFNICMNNADLKGTQTCIYYNGKNAWGGWGFCDLYNNKTGEVWELKKNSNSYSCRTENAIIQLNGYISGRLKTDLLLPLTKPTSTEIPNGSFVHTYNNKKYNVDYWYEGNGILRYDYDEIIEKDGGNKISVPDPSSLIVPMLILLLYILAIGMSGGTAVVQAIA